jgi:choline kinase
VSAHQAVILAAGRGSRLGAATASRPKALLPIGPRAPGDGGAEVSFLERQAELLLAARVEPLVVVAGYRHEQVTAALARFGRAVATVLNPEAEHPSSGSLHSLQCALRAGLGLLDGEQPALYLDADIVYHRDVLGLLLAAPDDASALLVCARHGFGLPAAASSTRGPESERRRAGGTSEMSDEEVLVWGTATRPRFLGKGLSPLLVGGAPCLGEAVGIVKLAAADHALARATVDWMLGDPDAPEGSLARRGFGPARRATEHEELTGRLMQLGRMSCVLFDERLPFMEVDSPEEYARARAELYPRILRMEA